MGYYTRHSLEVENADQKDRHLIAEAIADDRDTFYGLDPQPGTPTTWGCYDAVKWYSSHEDMIEFSKKFPRVLFILSGEGEEPGDIWKNYYKNGKSQRTQAELKFAEFDPKKLQ